MFSLSTFFEFCLFSCHALNKKRGHRKYIRGGRAFHFITKLQVILWIGLGAKYVCLLSLSLVKIYSKKCSLSGVQLWFFIITQAKGINIAGGRLSKKYMSILNVISLTLQTKHVLVYLYIYYSVSLFLLPSFILQSSNASSYILIGVMQHESKSEPC